MATFFSCLVGALLAAQAQSARFQLPDNPILRGADPHAVLLGDTVWIYPTTSSDRFFAFSSTDLRHWERHGPVLTFETVSWIKDDGQDKHYSWAPCLAVREDRFYFYYSVGPQHVTPSRIGVAVGDSPAGPFIDSGKPLLIGGNGFEAIDPMVFTGDASGKSYLYAGGSAGATLRVFELTPDMVELAGEIPVETPPKFTEGVFMHVREGVYYLSYSHGRWRDSSYSVHYATSDSPVGPWQYHGAILTSDDRHKGPGHHSVLHIPATDDWFIVYHRFNDESGPGPYASPRHVAIDRLEYDDKGLIQPVTMTGENPRDPACR